ncbi:MAG: DUF2442 domain-containing protein [Porphyromonadaceae bacterium]|nr:MAG: DUF2442 domain-containing protein [Porphyromonadaceae bacterium]
MKYMVAELMFTASKAWYENGMVCVLLNDNREVRFPVFLNKKMKNASVEQISEIEIICEGTGLHWPQLDEDLSVTGIPEGRF